MFPNVRSDALAGTTLTGNELAYILLTHKGHAKKFMYRPEADSHHCSHVWYGTLFLPATLTQRRHRLVYLSLRQLSHL